MTLVSVCRYAERKTVPFCMHIPDLVPVNRAEIALCESAYQIASAWLWLSLRFIEACPDRAAAEVRPATSSALPFWCRASLHL